MDFFDEILASTYLQSSSLKLLLDSMPQSTSAVTQRSGKEIMAAALTGRIRSDASMFLQGSKNAVEAENMATMVANSASTISDKLSEMLTLAQQVKADPTQGSVNSASFKTLANEISSIATSTTYNNISLLNKGGWTNDSRLTISSDGKTSTLNIQLGYDSSKFTLYDMSYLSYLKNVDLSSPTLDIDALISDLSTQISTADLIYNSNDTLAKSYASEADFMTKQSDILAKAAQDAMPTEEDPLLRDLGSIISTTS